MAVSAETAIRAWIMANPALKKRLPRGAYLNGKQPRSPAHGAYALLTREPGLDPDVVAEPGGPVRTRVTAHVYAGTIEAAEAAAGALSDAWLALAGRPEPCGHTGVLVLVADNHSGPGYVPMPGAGGEQHMFTVSATFILLSPG
jgi:hypothetical protein